MKLKEKLKEASFTLLKPYMKLACCLLLMPVMLIGAAASLLSTLEED